MSSSSSSSSSGDGGCGGVILLIIVIWLIFYATSGDVREWTNRIFKNEETAENAGDTWAENYPWPHSEVDAIKKCIFAIQSRNWENYKGCFEPSAVFIQEEPGFPGKFDFMSYELLDSDGQVGIVRVTGYWYPSPLAGLLIDDYVEISEDITVVKARKGFLDVQINVDFAMEGWFLAYTEKDKMPFNFSSRVPSLQPTSTPTPTKTLTPMPTLTPMFTPEITVTP
ncbi:MAG: hypothetical protein ABIJ39_03885 [Chloroflexota bacterium]